MPEKYILVPEAPGEAFGFVSIAGGRNIPLPGRFWMQAPGQWVNDATGVEVVWRSGADA